ncbi:MAG: CBS domain-containing protein [Acidobacteria bacterium]|nr:CBS domain-containing protein [Acidobacteriota bacterium]
MGTENVEESSGKRGGQDYVESLLNDLRALQQMLDRDAIESEPRRVGAEQELFLVDRNWQPAPIGPRILAESRDPHLTPELGRFNLEFNCDPLELRGDCLTRLEEQLNRSIAGVSALAERHGAAVLLTGILPSLTLSQLKRRNMTPKRRYELLWEAVKNLRGDSHQLHIKGIDELMLEGDTVMLEACNTAFQIHYQVPPDRFPHFYNIAQLVTAPVLAAATNSPFLLGKRLWKETRIALFERSIDTRRPSPHVRSSRSRVSFGDQWVRHSVLEIFQQDIARFRALMTHEGAEDPFEVLSRKEVPRLESLSLFNGTVYRWNRPCYGVWQGKPHLRIENRALPAGPSVEDEVANTAFLCGLMAGMAQEHEDVTRLISFEAVKSNFSVAAQSGLDAQLYWLGGTILPAPELIQGQLLPLARQGLRHCGINTDDIERFLGVIHQRVKRRQTGADWMLKSCSRMGGDRLKGSALVAVTAATHRHQQQGRAVHSWPLAEPEEAGDWRAHYQRVEQYMSVELFTVHPEDPVDLVANIMDWERVRHVPVEDEQGQLVGVVSYRSVLKCFSRQGVKSKQERVRAIMKPDPVTVPPETSSLEAVRLMRRHRIGCLPVVQKGRLVGIVTESDFLGVASSLLEQQLKE